MFPTARFSGPILKDKLWFSAAYAPQILSGGQRIDYFTSRNPNTRTISESINYEATRTVQDALVRIDWTTDCKTALQC